MTISLAIQSTYQSIEVGICFDGIVKVSAQEHKNLASKNIIPLIGSLLAGEGLTLADIAYIAVNQGPAPYTTLRVVIATVNGLAYATGKPIFGVDAFAALALEIDIAHYPAYIIFDAFNKDVYYARVENRKIAASGCVNILELPQHIREKESDTLYFIGNGCGVYGQTLAQLYPHAIFISDKSYPHLQSVATIAHQDWIRNIPGKSQISPLYLKEQKYKNQIGVMTSI